MLTKFVKIESKILLLRFKRKIRAKLANIDFEIQIIFIFFSLHTTYFNLLEFPDIIYSTDVTPAPYYDVIYTTDVTPVPVTIDMW